MESLREKSEEISSEPASFSGLSASPSACIPICDSHAACMGRVHHLLEETFDKVGRWAGVWPFTSVALTLFFSLICSSGMIFLSTSGDYEKLWYPDDTKAWSDKQFQEKHFGKENRTELAIWVAARVDEGGIVDKSALLDMLDLHELFQNSSEYSQFCSRKFTGGPCEVQSVLSVWNYSRSAIEGDDDIKGTLSQEVLLDVYGEYISLDAVLANRVYNDEGVMQSAEAARNIYYMLGTASLKNDIVSWELDRYLEDCQDAALEPHWKTLSCFAASSYQQESDRAIAEDTVIVSFSMLVMIIYVTVVLGQCHPIDSKVVLGLSIILTVGLSLAVAFGITSYFNVPFTTLSMMAIFILLGVGIDDMFILTDGFDRCHQAMRPQADLVEILGKTMAKVGPSILLTSATDMFAFMVGASITIPAIRYFCITAGARGFPCPASPPSFPPPIFMQPTPTRCLEFIPPPSSPARDSGQHDACRADPRPSEPHGDVRNLGRRLPESGSQRT